MKLHILLFSFTILLLNNCRNPEPEFLGLDQNFKDFIYFKDDTYWIYRNDSGHVDTQIVINSKIDESDPTRRNADPDNIFEFFVYEIISSIDSVSIEVSGGTRCAYKYDPETKFDCFWANYNYNVVFVWYPRLDFEKRYKNRYFTKLNNRYDSIIVNNKT